MLLNDSCSGRITFGMLLLFVALNLPVASQVSLPVDTRGDTLKIDLQRAILCALKHNPTIALELLQPEIAKTFLSEQRSRYEPVLAADVIQIRNKKMTFLGSQRTPFEKTTENTQYDVAVSQALPLGTTFSVQASMSGSITNIYSDQYTGNIGITITQALLKGFGLGANLAAIRSARLDVAMSRAELKAVVEEMVAQVENAYWDLYLTHQETEIQRQSLELANQQLRESLERVQVGKLPQLELAAVHAELAQRQEACLDARSRYLQARLRCIFLLNHPDSSGWSLIPVPVDRPFVPTDTLDQVAVHEQLGLKYRADLEQARLALKKGEWEIRRTKNGLLPQLDLFITLGRTTYANSFRAAAPDPHSPFYDINGGIQFQLPVLDQQARAQFRRAQYSHEQLALAVQNLERLVQWDVRAAHIEVLRSRQQIEATRVTRELQDQKLAAELEKFRVGKSTNYLVLQAQRDFTASQLDEARSMVAYLNALVNLYLMEGTLLDRRHLSLDAAR